MSKRYQKKSSNTKKREKSGHGPSRDTVGGGQTTGVMGNMIGGFRRAVGSESSKDSSGRLGELERQQRRQPSLDRRAGDGRHRDHRLELLALVADRPPAQPVVGKH
ncbi:MAG: hypothetical protein JRF55_18440 [Deltaproteobacteria bacterium]|nr:hypothetical protein [Deltaproteobacteria bacterium]